nr:AAA family ATPase [candidate division Zixibacteria bacterium]
MKLGKRHCLITGIPGVGKTTLINTLARQLEALRPVGFYTSEIRENGRRVGFELISLQGGVKILSHINIESQYRVGKYGVDVESFDLFLDEIDFDHSSEAPVVIDEIGKMECFSAKFRRLILNLMDSNRLVIATVALNGGGLAEKIKAREDVAIFEVTRYNRDYLSNDILAILTK